MNMPFKVLLPFDLALRLQRKLAELESIHDKEMKRYAEKVRKEGKSEDLERLGSVLKERRRRLHPHTLIRACVMAGLSVLDRKPEEIFNLMVDDTVKVGRPSHGTRAA